MNLACLDKISLLLLFIIIAVIHELLLLSMN